MPKQQALFYAQQSRNGMPIKSLLRFSIEQALMIL
jgi:hypothetical protein